MKDFHCTGSECADNCCHGWRIAIDPLTVEKYRAVTDPQLKPLFDEHLVEQDGCVFIKHRDDGNCPFLDADGLCQIQSRLGADYLSDTCTIYPRIYNSIDNRLELSAVPSCPEITRQLLLNPNSMELEERELRKDVEMKLTRGFYLSDPQKDHTPERYIYEIRDFLFTHLCNDTYTLEERLFIYGSIANDIDTLCEEKRSVLIPAYLEQLLISLSDENFVQPVKEKVRIQNSTMSEIIMNTLELAKEKNLGKDITLLSLQAFVGFGGTKEWDMSEDDRENVYRKYHDFEQTYLEPIFKDRNMLENLLLFFFFNRLMPASSKNAWESFIDLYTVYKISTTFLYGIAGCNDAMSESTVIRFIQVFSRLIFHSSSFNLYREMFESRLEPIGIFNLNELR